MKKISKWGCMILAVVMAVVMVGVIPVHAAEPAGPSVKVSAPDNKVLTYKYREKQDFVLNVTNTGDQDLANVTVEPILKEEGEKWPFQTEYQSYSETIALLPRGETAQVKFTFMERDDVPTARFVLTFVITATDGTGAQVINNQQSFYVNTTAKPAEEAKEDPKSGESQGKEQEQAVSDEGLMTAEAGGFDNGGVTYSGGGSGNGSVPRVIVTGFSTDPAQVKAGSDFTLTIHLKNTSKSTRVSNMLFELTAPTEGSDEQTAAPAFLPTSGSNSIYLEGMKANGTADISIQLNAKADLVQKPYSINLSMQYEDGNALQIEAQSSISIPVKQDARYEFSEFEITPDTIEVGDEANVSCSLYNLGRIKLYNVKAVFEGNDIEREELFIGHVEAGASASIDAMLEGKKAGTAAGKVKMTLSYEDESGAVSTTEKEFSLTVTEKMEEPAGMEAMGPEEKGFPVIPVLIVVVILIVLASVLVIRNKKKKQLLSEEEEGLLDELDRPSEDEQQ